MTDAVVGVLVTELLKNLKDQSNVFHEFQTQFDQLVINLTFMQNLILMDVRMLKELKDKEIVKSSLATLKEIIYAADDILLDCRIRYAYRTDHASKWYSFRDQTGNRLKEINIQIPQMAKNLHTYLVSMMNQKNIPEESNHNKKRWTTPIYNQSETVGLSEDTKKIKRWILPQNKELQRVGIVGMGGLGKTTLAQKIFSDIEVEARFEKRIWVSVSQTFTVTQIMKSMLEELNKADNDCNSEGMLLKKIREALTHKAYLIVMDDVWDTKDGFDWWKQISEGLPKEKEYSSSIIITTRNEEVAKCMGVVEERIHWPKILDKNESWTLFRNLAFNSPEGEECKDQRDQVEKEKVGMKIVEKCGGLPLAIKTIGGLMSTKPKLNDWEKIHKDFHGKLKDNGNYDSELASLQLSYDELRPELKHCILCFSIYPEDYIISTEQLVHWWVGEGFVSGNDTKTATQVAFDYLSELFRRCLIEVVNHRGYDGRIFECKMHDMVRELIIKMAKEEAFCSFDDDGSRHLGLTSKTQTQSRQSNSKLRALLLLTKNCPFSFSPNTTGLANVNSLRVLDLSQSKLDDGDFGIDDLLSWIKSQRRLAYLNLRGVAGLKQVPEWIRKLRNLRILILAECHDLEQLSPYINTLPKLTVLDIRNCTSLRRLPIGLGNLSNLEELSGFKLAKQDEAIIGCRLRDLESLSKLRVLRIDLQENDDIKDEELKVLSRLTNLHVLSIDTNDSKNEEFLKKVDHLVPPDCLEELYLRKYCRDFTPEWLTPSKLPKLQYLCIELAELTLKSPAFSDNNEQHWKILGLCLKRIPRLQLEWETVQTIMPELDCVEVSHCYKLQNFPLDAKNFGFWRKK